jgi:hypothetical protein
MLAAAFRQARVSWYQNLAQRNLTLAKYLDQWTARAKK